MSATDRVHGLDALRAFALLLGIVPHSALPYVLPPTGSTTDGGRASQSAVDHRGSLAAQFRSTVMGSDALRFSTLTRKRCPSFVSYWLPRARTLKSGVGTPGRPSGEMVTAISRPSGTVAPNSIVVAVAR